ncbi:MAG TPA: molybdopterin-dependent oxidoreductase [Micromonosporaceae bacterium]|nr:molybdopterin-dependent oxidoreductase [Micromonosporaceae bacterium]
MRPSLLYRIAGVAGFLCAVVLTVNSARRGGLLPVNGFTHAIAPFGPLTGLFALTGLYLYQRAETRALGLVAFAANAAGLAGAFAIEYTLHFVFPFLDSEVVTVLVDGGTGIAFTVTSVILVLGVLLFGAASWRAGRLPLVAVALYTVGMVPAALRNAVPEPVYLLGLLVAATGIAGCHWSSTANRGQGVDVLAHDLGVPGAGVVVQRAAVLYSATAATVAVAGLPGARRRFTGSYDNGSFDPVSMPTTIWLDDSVPATDPRQWRLTVVDAVGRSVLTIDDLDRWDDRRTVILDCTSGWYAEQTWSGVPLAALLRDTGGARTILVRSATGYHVRLPVGDLDGLLLATRVGGGRLSPGHGYPVRLVAPGRRGFWWVKWVNQIELSAKPWWWQSPFPLS